MNKCCTQKKIQIHQLERLRLVWGVFCRCKVLRKWRPNFYFMQFWIKATLRETIVLSYLCWPVQQSEKRTKKISRIKMERNGLHCTHFKVTLLSISLLSLAPAVPYLGRFMQVDVCYLRVASIYLWKLYKIKLFVLTLGLLNWKYIPF